MARTATNQQRRHVRHPFSEDLHVDIPNWTKARAIARDISFGGIRLQIPVELRIGDKLRFRLAVSRRRPIIVEAEVMHVAPCSDGTKVEAGLSWLPMPHHTPLLARFVNELRTSLQ